MSQPSLPTPEQLAASIQAEVLQAVRAGLIPPNVASFTDLHDYCDANCLGGTEVLLDRLGEEIGHEAALDQLGRLLNTAQQIVDRWIKAGGIRDQTKG